MAALVAAAALVSCAKPQDATGPGLQCMACLHNLPIVGTLLEGKCALRTKLPKGTPTLRAFRGRRWQARDRARWKYREMSGAWRYTAFHPDRRKLGPSKLDEAKARELAVSFLRSMLGPDAPCLGVSGVTPERYSIGMGELFTSGWTVCFRAEHAGVPLASGGATVQINGGRVAHALVGGYTDETEIAEPRIVISSEVAVRTAAKRLIERHPGRPCNVTRVELVYAPVSEVNGLTEFRPTWRVILNMASRGTRVDAFDRTVLAPAPKPRPTPL
ncbi:MAG: hypothetical protein ACYTKD_22855 [Planctomycetota bacterium]|jgi:hypothetical protein